MRNNTNWERLLPKYIKNFFTPRLQDDLQALPFPRLTEFSNKSVFIFGDIKTGKTVLAAQMMLFEMKRIYLNEIPNCHNNMYFVSFSEIIYNIKKSFDEKEAANKIMDMYLNAHFLVIDDFLAARPTDWVLELFYHLINHRYENKKQTIITCNFDLKKVEAILQDQRIVSRIARSYTIVEKTKTWK